MRRFSLLVEVPAHFGGLTGIGSALGSILIGVAHTAQQLFTRVTTLGATGVLSRTDSRYSNLAAALTVPRTPDLASIVIRISCMIPAQGVVTPVAVSSHTHRKQKSTRWRYDHCCRVWLEHSAAMLPQILHFPSRYSSSLYCERWRCLRHWMKQQQPSACLRPMSGPPSASWKRT